MDYALAVDGAPETIPAGTGVLLVHPSTAETDRVDTDFLKTDTDRFLVISTRTSAREVTQKLEHYEVEESKATILDALSVERGYTRRQSDDVRYVSAPDDLDGIVEQTRQFLKETEGRRRISLDSLTELIYYTDVERTIGAAEELLALLGEHDAVGLFHLAGGVHDEEVVSEFRERFNGVVDLDPDGTTTATF
ncbi:DUF7090 family protein [Halorhabdus rudnickae]|uniref:DUF7090 family protein n=1 Tax=Halorhabdus rudnickae TaxID=1775544 RepID=UPI0010834E8B|nr:hypothetical protein [Halorhabdus rudnickae]